jgi:hypothetical protein
MLVSPLSAVGGSGAPSRSPERNGVAVAESNGAAAHLSPSLLSPAKGPASFEMKFLVSHVDAAAIEAWAAQRLALDPNVEPDLGNAYRIRSVYLDTEQLDVFQQTQGYKRRKYRIRGYGNTAGVFLERKAKAGGRVRKRRVHIGDLELERLRDSALDPEWAGHWFHRRVLTRRLTPRCLIQYERAAYVGVGEAGPIRLTLDRKIRCALVQGYDLQSAGPCLPLLADAVILELKFRAALPALFKQLVAEMALNPQAVSKYRMGIQVWDLAHSAKEVG